MEEETTATDKREHRCEKFFEERDITNYVNASLFVLDTD